MWVCLVGLGNAVVVTEGGAPPRGTIYEVLKSHGLPMGLLPKGVTDFKIDERGRFEAHLDQACNAKFESQLHYDRNVTGTLSYGQIGALSGISAQELFLWFPVKGIRVDVPSSGLIYFDVGVVFKQFSLSLFESPPDCTEVSRVAPLLAPPMYKMRWQRRFGRLQYRLDRGNGGSAVV